MMDPPAISHMAAYPELLATAAAMGEPDIQILNDKNVSVLEVDDRVN